MNVKEGKRVNNYLKFTLKILMLVAHHIMSKGNFDNRVNFRIPVLMNLHVLKCESIEKSQN